jgi:hypothetical protein
VDELEARPTGLPCKRERWFAEITGSTERAMKFALVNEQPQEAQPHLSGKCRACGGPMIARCGEHNIWHWAHKRDRNCDPWWENETEWHRAWKGQFPIDWQEFVHRAENGERHIADVKTDQGWVLEFQNSYIKPEERRSRETFYPKILWVVNGARRKRDRRQFMNVWEEGRQVAANSAIRRVFPDECALLRDWAGSPVPVLLHFPEEEQMLWWLLHTCSNGLMHVAPFSRADFIKAHRGGATDLARPFDALVDEAGKFATVYELLLRARRF